MMELVFQEDRMEYLSNVLSECVTQEQTADVVIPDSYPDAERIVDVFGTVLVRSEECAAGSAGIAGFVQAGVLYVSPDGELRRVQTEIPFSVRREFAPQEQCFLQCRCTLNSVDGRILNSRKILIRAGVSCAMEVYSPKIFSTFDVEDAAPNLQLKRKKIPMQMPMGLGEKSFVLNEELELPSDKPEISHLLKCLYRTQLQEQKMVGDKAVFKGSLLIHTLYESSDGGLYSHDWTVPFSQYAELGRQLDECAAQTVLTLTGADTEPDGQLDSRRLLTSVNILAQCMALGVGEIAFVEDAFCTDAEFAPQWYEDKMTGILDRQHIRETAAMQKELPVKTVVDAWAYPRQECKQRLAGQVQVELPLCCHLLYRDTDGQLQFEALQMPVNVQTELHHNARCCLRETELGSVFTTAGNESLSLRVPVNVLLESYAEQPVRGICGGEINPIEKNAEPRPGVILRFTDAQEDVWDIAKDCRTTVSAIRQANDLTGDTVPADTLLLIPM